MFVGVECIYLVYVCLVLGVKFGYVVGDWVLEFGVGCWGGGILDCYDGG